MATSTYAVQSAAHVDAIGASRRFYAPELDVLRFGAFLLVFGRHFTNALGHAKYGIDASQTSAPVGAVATVANTHTSFLSSIAPQEIAQSLDFGVCLFFFLSSFLITRLLLIERAATGDIHIGQFYMRRSLRIWPLYFFFLLLVLVLSQLFPVLHVSMHRLVAALFFVGNWAAVLHGWNSIAIQPLWSVSVEEQFYVLWPGFARYGKRAVLSISACMILVSMLTLIYFGHAPGTQVTATWPNTLVQSLFLAAGAITACVSSPEERTLRSSTRAVFLILGGACWLAASAGCHVVRTQSPGSISLVAGYLLILAGTALIFNAVAGYRARPFPAWLLYLGKISYGLYVFHVACLLLMGQATHAVVERFSLHKVSPYLVETIGALLAFGVTLVCAMLTYRYIERPFLKLKSRFTTIRSRPV